MRKGVVDLVDTITGIEGIENVSMTTNGVLLPRMIDDLKAAGLSRVNISLDTLDADQFHEITRTGRLEDTLAGIDAALAAGLNPVKVNAVAVRSLDQDFLEFAKLSIDRPLHVRFIEYMPVGDTSVDAGTGWGKEDVIPSEELFDIINERARAAGLPELRPAGATKPLGWGPARYFEFPDALGTVGFISPLSVSYTHLDVYKRQHQERRPLQRGLRLLHQPRLHGEDREVRASCQHLGGG